MPKYILSIDQGTTGSTVMVIDDQLKVLAKVNQEFPQIYPKPGWVEHDPEEIWGSVCGALGRALIQANIISEEITCIGITNQRETTLMWDRATGVPIHNAIVWQDRRTADRCRAMREDGLSHMFKERTGLVLDPYFSGTKIRWLLENVPGARQAAEAGELAFGTVDSYLIWRLTGGKKHVTDVSNASRTLLYNLHDLRWDPDLMSRLHVPEKVLPQVRGSSEVYGHTQGVPGVPDGIPVSGAAGDQQAALFGQACFEVGDAKCTYGTGAFLLMNTGSSPVTSDSGLLTTVAWWVGDEITYALEGSAFIAGAAVQWLRDGLKLIDSAPEVEQLAASVPDSGGVVFVPALVGLGAPHWRPEARGLIQGITRGTTDAHLARAVLDGIALSIHDLTRAMLKDTGRPLASFKVDGGATANNLLMQYQADILDQDIIRPVVTETTAMGAAMLAGLAVDVWSDPGAIKDAWKQERVFSPQMSADTRKEHLDRWAKVVKLA